MIIASVLVAALVVARARGGRLSRLAETDVRLFPLLFVPLALQLLLYSPLPGVASPFGAAAGFLHVVTFALAALVVFANLRLDGFVLLWCGLMTNLSVVVANSGYMPVAAAARAVAGLPPLAGPHNNVVPMTDATPFWFLGDLLPLPSFVPFAQVYSIGDLLIALGLVWFIQSASGAGAQRSSETTARPD